MLCRLFYTGEKEPEQVQIYVTLVNKHEKADFLDFHIFLFC